MKSTSCARPSGYADRPDGRINLLRPTNRIDAHSGTRRLASSTNVLIVDEQGQAEPIALSITGHIAFYQDKVAVVLGAEAG